MKNTEVSLMLLCIIVLVGVLKTYVNKNSIDRKIEAVKKFIKWLRRKSQARIAHLL